MLRQKTCVATKMILVPALASGCSRSCMILRVSRLVSCSARDSSMYRYDSISAVVTDNNKDNCLHVHAGVRARGPTKTQETSQYGYHSLFLT